MLETFSFGKEFKVSLEFKANTVGDKWYNILEIGDRPGVVGVWLDTSSKVFVASKVSGSEKQTRTGAISTGTWYKLEVTQSLLVDKVNILFDIFLFSILLKYYSNIIAVYLRGEIGQQNSPDIGEHLSPGAV